MSLTISKHKENVYLFIRKLSKTIFVSFRFPCGVDLTDTYLLTFIITWVRVPSKWQYYISFHILILCIWSSNYLGDLPTHMIFQQACSNIKSMEMI